MTLPRIKLIILLAVFLVSLIYSFSHQIPPMVDARKYDNFALHLSQGGEYDVGGLKFAGPGYPLFLAGIYKILGHHIEVVWLIQALLHALTALLVFKITSLVFRENAAKEKIALLAMAIYGFWPDLIQSTAILMTEILYLFFAALATYAALRDTEADTPKWVAFFGLIIGLATLVRPVALVLLLFVIAYWLWRKSFANVIMALIVFTALVAPFSYYFSQKAGSFVFLSNAGGFDLWLGNNPKANGEIIAIPETEQLFAGLTETEINKKGVAEVFKFIKERPVSWLKLQVVKTSKYFSLIRPYGFWFYLPKWQQLLIVIPSTIWLWLTMIGGLSGAMLALKNIRTKANHLFAVMALASPAAIIPIIVETRFRFQFYIFLAVYTAYFLSRLWSWKNIAAGEKKIIAAIAALLIINAGADVWREKDLVTSKINFYKSSDQELTRPIK